MSSWMNLSAREWLAVSAGASPAARGGGPAAAYTGALGASLVLRACERTLASGGREAVAADLEVACRDLQALVERLGMQVDRAAQILETLASAAGTEDLALAHREATETFLDPFDACFAVLETAQRAVDAVRPEDVAELGIGSDLAAASLEALAICVRVSLPLVGDEKFTRPVKGRLVGTLHEARRLRDRILQAVEGRLVL